jgi:hypothetical protein
MSRRTAAWIAWSLWGLIAVLGMLALDLSELRWYWFLFSHPFRYGAEDFSENVILPIIMVLAVPAYATVGAVVASLRPKNGVGWLCIAISGFLLLLSLAPYSRVYGGNSLTDQLYNLTYLLGGVAWSLTVPPLLVTLMLLIFPDGRLPSRRWWAVVGIALVGYVLRVPATFELYTYDAVALAEQVGLWTSLAALLASVAALVLRWRRGIGQQRQQIKLLTYTVAVTVVALLAAIASWYAFDDVWGAASYPTVVAQLAALAGLAVGIPVAIGVAVLKYSLYDIDLLINRTLVYALLTAMLVAVYVGGIVLLQRVFVVLTGEKSTLAVVASTLLIAALFNPLRYRIQSFIDRRFYRRRYDARKTLEAFSTSLRDGTDLKALNAELVGVVAETMQPAHVSLWLRPDTSPRGERVS